MFLNERGYIMNISSYEYQWPLLRLFLDWRTINQSKAGCKGIDSGSQLCHEMIGRSVVS
jgi:hypothetical protein